MEVLDKDRRCAWYCGSRTEELCVPGSSECSDDLARRNCRVSTLEPDEGTGAYGSAGGMSRRKGIETSVNTNVPSVSSSRNRPVSSLKINDDRVDQKNALSPNAASGKAVAVPRCSGKLVAATTALVWLSYAYHAVSNWLTCLDGRRKGRAAPKSREKDKERQQHHA